VSGEISPIEPRDRAERLLGRETASPHDHVVVPNRLGKLCPEGPFDEVAVKAEPPTRDGEGSRHRL